MNPFSGILREINSKLDLPQPEKSKIILEISSDLWDSLEFFESQGFSREEAVKKAIETFKVSDDSIQQLKRIHESLYRRLMDRLSKQVQTRWERAVLFFLLVLVSLFSGTELFKYEFFTQSSRFIWVIVALTVSVFVLTLWKSYVLYIKKDHRLSHLRNGLPLLFFLGIGSFCFGIYGSVIETYFTLDRVGGNMIQLHVYGIEYLLKISSLMIVSLLVTILTGLCWFVLMNTASRIEQAEAAVLLEGLD